MKFKTVTLCLKLLKCIIEQRSSGNNKKYNKNNYAIINQIVPREISKYFCPQSVYHVR